MEMESSRRPFDRSREPGLKKPRLGDEPERNPSLNRPFGAAVAAAQRPIAGNPMVQRFRAAESVDSGRGGGGYQPQPLPAAQQQHQELVSQYREALAELTFNSKPIITNLTIIAGENLHAAKAIAATVCANIIEVPSEQKLPSLYLLDSIVKNIGREYIKNFASRLPEVFCKAYRQVEPPVHQSMRHLFGTWKGVFPAQTLQMIEKELGFAPTVNGTSAGAATSRPDSQSNRPLHNSIHVNPKYLERQQRLQQPSRAKGSPSDLSGSIPNSIEDAERTDRATSISTGRSWVDPSARAHNMERANRGSESIHEKNIGAEYADYDYGSDFSRNSGLGIERAGSRSAAEQGHERNLYGGASSIAESLSGQRNSFNIKHGFPNYLAPKSTSANVHLQSGKNIASRSSGGISSDSWKNSDEEEFRWSDMNSRLADHGASDISSNLRKDRSASEDSDKSGLEDHLQKPQGINDYATRIDKVSAEQKEFGAILPRTSSPWLSKESHSIDGRPNPGTSSFGFPANPVSGSTGALTQQRLQSLKSGPPQSLRQGPPSPTLTARHPHLQLHSLTEQDRAKTQPLSHPDSKVSQFSGQLNTGVHNPYPQDSVPVLPSHARLGKMVKSQSNDILASSSIPAFQQRHQYSIMQPVEDPTDSELLGQIQKSPLPPISNSGIPSTLGSYVPDSLSGLALETLGASSASSLLAAVMKSGILSNSSITTGSLPNPNAKSLGQLSSQKGKSLLPSKPIPTKFMNPESKVEAAASASLKLSQKKVEHTPLPSGRPPSSSPVDSVSENASNDAKNASSPISNLLSSLVAKGLISAPKSESPSVIPPVAPTETPKKSPSVTSTSSVPVSSTRDDDTAVSGPTHSSPVALPKSAKLEIKNLIGFNFKQNMIREFHPTVISDLLDGYEHRCTICGLQLKLQEQLNRHLEWHAMKKAEFSGSTMGSRKWYLRDWISGKGLESKTDLVGEPEKTTDNDEPMVPADESQCVCVLCGEIFEDFYCQEKDEWMFKGAVHVMIPFGGGEITSTDDDSLCKGPIVHASCISESSLQDLGLVSKIKMEKDV